MTQRSLWCPGAQCVPSGGGGLARPVRRAMPQAVAQPRPACRSGDKVHAEKALRGPGLPARLAEALAQLLCALTRPVPPPRHG